MEHPDRTGLAGTPGNGPFLVLYLKIQDGGIAAAKFQTYGCGPMIACGSILTEMILGKTREECLRLTPEDLIEALDDGIPFDKLHCPVLAIEALQSALKEREL